MARIICLANSKKLGGRCLAGIDIATGEWVRPVSSEQHQEITWAMRQTNGVEPKLLDVIEIPLQATGDDIGCQPENRLLAQGNWQLVKQLKPSDVSQYYDDDSVILHNSLDRVPFDYFSGIPNNEWKSLQLIHNTNVLFDQNPWGKWKANFQDGQGHFYELAVTDPIILSQLEKGRAIGNDCIMAISLGGPYQRTSSDPVCCFKLVAGVIEL